LTRLLWDVDGKTKKAWEQPTMASSSNANNCHALPQAAGMADEEMCAAWFGCVEG
jgi:hypothetical protein